MHKINGISQRDGSKAKIKEAEKGIKKQAGWDFRIGPVVKTPASRAAGVGSAPAQGTNLTQLT